MRLAQLRDKIAALPDDQLRAAVVELYKRLPRKLIAEKEIDELLSDPVAALAAAREARQRSGAGTANLPDLAEVEREVKEFVSNAHAQNYFAPNRFVPKQERPKWRFIVKRFYKDLLALSRVPDNVPTTCRLLTDLYLVLTKACSIYLFSTDDPFRSVGIPQEKFFSDVMALMVQCEPPASWISFGIDLIVNQPTSPSTLERDIMLTFINFLTIPDLKQEALAMCDLRRRDVSLQQKRVKPDLHEAYKYQKKERTLVELWCRISLAMGETDQAIRFFKENYRDPIEDTPIYGLLRLLEDYNLDEHWLREYEATVREGWRPSRPLLAQYRAKQQ